jgi:septal ring factor EnvC (AmiA/AmiB activator)
VALLLAAGLVLAAGAAAQDSVETAQRRELERVQREAAAKREAAKRLLGQENRELSSLRRTDRKLNVTRRRLRALQQRQASLGRELETTRESLERNLRTLAQQKARLARRLRSLYKYGPDHQLEFLLSTQSFARLLARWDFLVMVAEQDRTMVEDVLAQKELVEAEKRRLTLNLDEIGRTAKRTDRESAKLASLRQQKATEVKSIQNQRQAYEAAAAELERTAASIRRLLAQLERKRREEADRARQQGRAVAPYSGDFARGQGGLDWPVTGEIVGRFGTEKHPKWGTVTMNNGIDIATPIGTGVRAVAKGRVDYVSDDFASYGQIVILNHGDGYYTLYGHLSSISVAVGQEVAPGQVVGRSGDTGSLKGPILHFEVRQGAQSLDPESWLR